MVGALVDHYYKVHMIFVIIDACVECDYGRSQQNTARSKYNINLVLRHFCKRHVKKITGDTSESVSIRINYAYVKNFHIKKKILYIKNCNFFEIFFTD